MSARIKFAEKLTTTTKVTIPTVPAHETRGHDRDRHHFVASSCS